MFLVASRSGVHFGFPSGFPNLFSKVFLTNFKLSLFDFSTTFLQEKLCKSSSFSLIKVLKSCFIVLVKKHDWMIHKNLFT